ncbi:DUF434 domain-containing protein [Anaerosporobacter sp.]|uniref:DUF434 domain-containing protein n=1 Tax=Anaerosporobacter sp. TaxID=1872529 RepID=UPI00286F6352|nr:DUF434 domain-containing protein [Anaerosporobacter sp.]
MSKVVRRGYQKEDVREFQGVEKTKLEKAAYELYFLLNQGYPIKQATTFIGNHYMFSERQRLALARTVSSNDDCSSRWQKQIKEFSEVETVHIDGFNVIITLEVALSGSPVFKSLDGTIRDLAGLRGNYRIIDKTEKAIHLIYQWLVSKGIKEAIFYLDSPVSNSGRLAGLLKEMAEGYELQVQTVVIPEVDVTLETKANVITTDAIIINKCISWLNMNTEIVKQIENVWEVLLCEEIQYRELDKGIANMQGYNCIMVYNQKKDNLLFCKRKKDPYLGLYNFVGGKIEENEEGILAAYRELEEETGIKQDKIELNHMMDFVYYNQDCYVEVYVGFLKEEVELREEANPLEWLDFNHDFFDCNVFAGEGNIGHMVEQVKQFGCLSQSMVM